MAVNVQSLIDAVALGFGSEVLPEDASPRENRRTVWERTRDRLAWGLIKQEWRPAADLDVGIWGPLVGRAEADRCLQDAAERGALYLEDEPSNRVAPRSRLRRLISGR